MWYGVIRHHQLSLYIYSKFSEPYFSKTGNSFWFFFVRAVLRACKKKKKKKKKKNWFHQGSNLGTPGCLTDTLYHCATGPNGFNTKNSDPYQSQHWRETTPVYDLSLYIYSKFSEPYFSKTGDIFWILFVRAVLRACRLHPCRVLKIFT